MRRGGPGPEQAPLFTLVDEFLPIDADERELVTTGGLASTMFVEAGAGSGKTSTLVARLVNLVCLEGVPVANIAAITFTEAAAAELRDRVRAEFEKRALEAHSVVIRRRCEDALEGLDTAAISTLHSFAQRILSEHSIDAGVPPRFEVVDEVQSAMAFDERWRDWLDVILADPTHHELILRSRVLGLSFSSRGARSVKLIAREFDQNWDRLGRVSSGDGLRPLVLTSLRPSAERFLEEFRTNSLVPDGMHQRLQRWLALAAHIVNDEPNLRNFLIVDELTKTKFGTPRKAAWVDVERMKAVAWAFRDEVVAKLDQARSDVLRRWCELIGEFTLASADVRRHEGQLEFHDLLVLARNLVRTSLPAQRSLHDRYTRLLIDEFQDTDPLQLEIALRIAVGEHDGSIVWTDLAVPAGRVCVVGDPKQSIYRFRRADVAMFGRARAAFDGASTSVVLRQNFRTVRPIIDWVNEVFAEGFGSVWSDEQPAYQSLEAAREPAPGVDHRVVLLGGPVDDLNAEQRRNAEAADVAAAVLATQRVPGEWLVHDLDTGRWRPPAYSDIAILVPSRLSLPALQDALRDAGIPYRAEAATLVYDSSEVRELVSVLRAIDDPSDEIAIVASLRSSLFGCGDDDLARYVAAGGRWDYRAAVPGEGVVEDGLAYLRAKHEGRHWIEPSTLLDEIVRERHVYELALALPRPREVWRRTRFLIEQARLYSEAKRASLRGFLEWAERQRNEAARVHEPLLFEADDDSVRIMTIHGAKGLEFPIVFVSGLSAEHSRGHDGVSVRWVDGAPPEVKLSSLATPDFQRRDAFEQEMGHHERMRLLYVACTRARDHLAVGVYHKPVADEKRRSHAQFLWGVSPPSRPFAAPQGPPPAPRPVARSLFDDTPEHRVAFAAGRAALVERAAVPAVVSATAISKDTSLDEAPRPRSALGRAGTAIGRAVHAVLQAVDFIDPVRLEELSASACYAEGLNDVDAVARRVSAALAAPVVRAVAAQRHWREMFVAAPLAPNRAVEGFIDLVVHTDDGLVIVDYKTDDITRAPDVVERYATQVAVYALALEHVSESFVTRAVLLFVGVDGATEVAIEGAELEAAKERVLAALATARRHPFNDSGSAP